MSIMHLRVEVCDVCQNRDRVVTNYRVAAPGDRMRTIALCQEHAAPLRELLEQLEVAHTARRVPKRGPVSMDEVKAARKRAPQRKK